MEELKIYAQNIRKKIIETAGTKFSAHFGGCFSSVEILSGLYGRIMNTFNHDRNALNRDRFILSKGHCALALYTTLNEFGFISDEDLSTFDKDEGSFPTHCVQIPEKGIDISSGSLGLGFSMGVGIALALMSKHSSGRVFVLCGNGEANEGIFWEAAMFAGAKKLDNIVLILDSNKMQNDGFSHEVLDVNNFKEKLASFGWFAVEADGHNIESLIDAFNVDTRGLPLAVIANTVKGKGISFMENNPQWHHNKLSPEQYETALSEIEKMEK